MSHIPEASLNFTWGGDFKSVTDQGILEGDGIVFGSETEHDLSSFKDFFTSDTFVHPDTEFTTSLFMEHGFNYRSPIGKAKMVKSDTGWKVSAELNLNDPEVKSKFEDIKKGGWGFSTGAVSHVVERDKKSNGTHFIKQWAVGELSITKTPAEPKALVHSVKSMDAYYNGELGSPMQMPEEDMSREFNDEMLAGMSAMVSEITSIKELMLKWHEASMTEPKSEPNLNLELNLEPNEPGSAQPDDSTEQLTVLKSIFDELETKNIELQSSFNEKEALLSEKMVLLSETQAELEVKSQEIKTLEEALIDAEANIENLKKALETEKRVSIALGMTNFSK